MLRATLMVADAATRSEGKLYVLGGGWNVTSGKSPHAVLVHLEFEEAEAGESHELLLELIHADSNRTVEIEQPDGGVAPLRVAGTITVPRHQKPTAPGTPIVVSEAFTIAPLPLPRGALLGWRLAVDGESRPDWTVRFGTRPEPETPPAD